MLAFLKLIRLPNLLIIAFTQYMIRLCMIEPMLHQWDFYIQVNDVHFAMLVLATVLIAAGGYAINDYFDAKIDHINKPEQQVLDHGVNRRVAMLAHIVLTAIGVLMGVYLSWQCNILLAGSTLFAGSAIGLWFYSTSFKYQFFSGNFLISLFTGMVPFMVAVFEVPKLILRYSNRLAEQQVQQGDTSTHTIMMWAGAYGLAAFGLSMIREVIKDMEDVEGDREYGCRTIPIVLGINKTKAIVAGLILVFMTGIGYVQYVQITGGDKYSFMYFTGLIQVPMIFVFFNMITAQDKNRFHYASMFIKFIMLTGICYLFMLKFVLLQ